MCKRLHFVICIHAGKCFDALIYTFSMQWCFSGEQSLYVHGSKCCLYAGQSLFLVKAEIFKEQF